MIAFEMDELIRKHTEGDALYLEFLCQRSMSMGLYVLASGTKDPQSPHNESVTTN